MQSKRFLKPGLFVLKRFIFIFNKKAPFLLVSCPTFGVQFISGVSFIIELCIFYLSFTSVFKHFVQSVLLTAFPFSMIVVFCKFGLNLRFVARWEKLRLCPKVVVFPQISHFALFNPFQ